MSTSPTPLEIVDIDYIAGYTFGRSPTPIEEQFAERIIDAVLDSNYVNMLISDLEEAEARIRDLVPNP